MADVHDKVTRSYNMSRIRSKDTKPEILVRKALFAHGLRFRLYSKDLPGKPDIVLKKYRIVIFVHGCFWHGHTGCRYFSIPKTNQEWWTEKIEQNKKRDYTNTELIKSRNWTIIQIWECELKPGKRTQTLSSLVNYILLNQLAAK